MILLTEISVYVAGHKADVANGSFGTGFAQAKMLIQTVAEGLNLKLSDEEIKTYSVHFINELVANGEKMVAESKNTLWVFAAEMMEQITTNFHQVLQIFKQIM